MDEKEYIESEAAIATACEGCNKEFPNEPCEPADCAIQQGLFKIPAADVVEVVRCKDCDYANGDGTICHRGIGRVTNPMGYCHNGKKMDGKGEG